MLFVCHPLFLAHYPFHISTDIQHDVFCSKNVLFRFFSSSVFKERKENHQREEAGSTDCDMKYAIFTALAGVKSLNCAVSVVTVT